MPESRSKPRSRPSFIQHCQKVLPPFEFEFSTKFKSRRRNTHQYLQRFDRPSFFDDEKAKVRGIKKLLRSGTRGNQDLALSLLLDDFANDNGIQYFNKVRHMEENEHEEYEDKGGHSHISNNDTDSGDKVKLKSNSAQSDKENIDSSEHDGDDDIKSFNRSCHCSWEGYTSSHKALHCTNERLVHPWKTFINVCGNEERVETDCCGFHQKFCVDESKRHTNKIIRITCPNEFALCTECFVLKEGRPPRHLERIPGLRRRSEGQNSNEHKEEVDNGMHSHMERKKKRSEEDAFEEQRKEIRDETKVRNDLWTQVVAAKRIQLHWRKYRMDTEKEFSEYQQYHLQNSAALKIQAFFRHFVQMQKVTEVCSTEEQLVHQEKVDSIQKVTNNLIASFDYSTNTRIFDHYTMINSEEPCPKMNANLRKEIIGRKPLERPDFRAKDNIKIIKKCKLSACPLCSKVKRKFLPRRNIISNNFFHDKELLDTRNMVADISPFRAADPFQLGSISQRRFVYILQKLWHDAGQPLPQSELKSIVRKFDSRNGYINYERYLRFAGQQIMPCTIHSRFVCTSPLCNLRFGKGGCEDTSCRQFTPVRPGSKFCTCGNYLSRHGSIPIRRMEETRKRGVDIFSTEDLKRTFDRRTIPDTDANVRFKDLESCSSVQPTTPRIKGKVTRAAKMHAIEVRKTPNEQGNEVTSETTNSTSQPSTADEKPETYQSSHAEESTANNSQLDVYTSFSPENLSVMLKECIKYRTPSVQKKKVIPCPLCDYTFFNETLLKKHLLRRHTKKEIEFHLRKKDHPKDTTMTTTDATTTAAAAVANTARYIQVQWIGKYVIVPPLPSPVPIDICYNHVPPHPKCRKCKDSMEKCPLFPPIRFYSSVFVEYEYQNGKENSGEYDTPSTQSPLLLSSPSPSLRLKPPQDFSNDNSPKGTTSSSANANVNVSTSSHDRRKFHFNLKSKDFGVVMESGRIAKIEALCEDAFQRYFLGVKYYFSPDEFLQLLEIEEQKQHESKKSCSFSSSSSSSRSSSPLSNSFLEKIRHLDSIITDRRNELIMNSEVSWVEMKYVKNRCYVFTCSHDEFLEKKRDMGLSNDEDGNDGDDEESTKVGSGLKFCHLLWTGNDLVEIRDNTGE